MAKAIERIKMNTIHEYPKRNGISNIAVILAIVFLAVTILVVVVLCISMFGQSDMSKEIDLVQDITIDDIKITGYDGEAIARVDNERLRKLIDYNRNNDKVSKFIESVTFEVTPDSSLKNGDKITVKAIYDRTDAKDAQVTVSRDNISFRISGIDDHPEDVDVDYEEDEFDDASDDSDIDSEYKTMEIDTSNAVAKGGTDDGYANIRSTPDASSDDNIVTRLYEGETVYVYLYSDHWYMIASGTWSGCYIHYSSLEPVG